MKKLAILALFAAVNPLNLYAKDIKIIGGTKSKGHDFFLQLSMDGTLSSAYCGSTSIAPGVAVTAAHCVASKTRKFKLVHGLQQDGVSNLTVLDVHAVISHQDYSGTFNDIALIFYDQSQAEGKVIPAPINRGNITLNDDTNLLAIGRGNMTSIGTLYGSDLYEVKLPYIDNATCSAVTAYAGAIHSKHECAGTPEGGIDSCQGDSGGPLVAMVNGSATLVGVTNFGLGCAQKGLPGVYASLRAHASWIDTNIARYKNNEIVAEPNMDFAFASKCYLLDMQEETLQQQNVNDVGMLNISSLYLPKTRFAKVQTSISTTGKNICNFQTGTKSFSVYAEMNSSKKVIIKNNLSGQTWEASGKRQTDSLYQRCYQSAPMALSFDIAVGEGDALINLNNNIARLVPLEETQIPTDMTKVGGCDIGKYETTISTSQAAGAILVTLKNHIDDQTVTLAMSASSGNNPTPTGPQPGKLTASLDVDTSATAKLTIDNQSDEDLFTWEIKCSKDFSALNFNKTGSRSIRYMSTTDSKGTVREGESVEITLNFASVNPNADGKLECTINRDLKVVVQ
ncbi:MAG: hypothetical protein COW01_02760 [Bdellovibrionales bacterium CG12_big_fil_rev_8_21_14_0_65_38_15]|nr:MAG: hypothetical protein COW79_08425 [Bdellovibrionales bacterium CG22_combo_CG10-13_8_21_14_all_38_13]PIQ57014.1 MAG: hypothetical protein COW01_02760 [Bdellovibrionales bacterium CG12_big_fil_rev_8_21_14_0_65_38_15]PIR29025.1 MAG: hypothetical protein COV38_12360 [Bdellovibrionales bacterium CG11_big_fil_rev_8_21_14_0_20_38_13]